MPTISKFYGITIVMNLRGKEHNPPHVYAITDDLAVPFSIETGDPIEGGLSKKACAMVKEFILTNKKELEEMWEKQEFYKIPPLD